MESCNFIINQVFSGLVYSAIYFLVTSGLTLLFGVVGVLNMAHFSLYMIASYVTWSFVQLLPSSEYSFWVAFAFSGVVMSALAWAIERVVMKYIYHRTMPEQLLITFAMVYIFDDLTKMIWSATPLFVNMPKVLMKTLNIGPVSFPVSSVFVVLLGLTTGIGVWLLLSKTRLGKILRAAYSHKEMIVALGTPIHRVYMIMFVLSVFLASIAGSAWTIMGTVELGQGHGILIESFCVMVIGGLGSFTGTAAAATLCGMIYSFAILFIPRMATLLIFVIAGIVLIVRPWGLMGTVGRLH